MTGDDQGRWRLWAALNAAALMLPFLVVTFPPLTDLPQHLAMVQTAGEVWAGQHPQLRLQPWAPYTLGYVPMAALWPLVGPLWAGRLTFALVVGLWAWAVHAVAHRAGRPPEVAALASLMIFGHPLYWGFLSFVVGAPVFLAWLLITGGRDGKAEPAWKWLVCLALLWMSHALWFAAGLAVGGLYVLRAATQRRWLWGPAAVLALGTAGAAFWYVASWDVAMPPSVTGWQGGIARRLNLFWFTDAVLGGLRGPVEVALVVLLAGWVVWAVVERRHELRRAVRWDLLLVGAVFVLAAFALPYKFKRTIFFGSRWTGVGVALLLLAAPVGLSLGRVRRWGAALVVGAFMALTTALWVGFDRDQMSGLEEALAQVQPSDRVVGLDYLRRYEAFDHRPYMQCHAYAKALAGADLEFSFVEFPHMPVSRRRGHVPSDHRSIHWQYKNFRRADLRRYSRILAVGRPEDHHGLVETYGVLPLTDGGPWRLYATSP